MRKIGVEVKCGDLKDDEAVRKALVGQEIIFHVGAKAGFWGPLKDYYDVNVRGTENVISACRENRISSLVFTSSASVVFDGTDIEGRDESFSYPQKPLSHYTRTKAEAEKAVLNANNQDLRTLSLRPHLVWGPGDQHILPRIIQQARSGKLRIIGKGQNLVDTTYIDNAVQAHLCAAKALSENPGSSGRSYFISNGEPLNLWQLLNQLLTVSGLEPLKKTIPERSARILAGTLESIYKILPTAREPRITRFLVHELCASHWFDISAARTELGYVPQVSIKEGLNRLRKHYKING